jgi:hypothetical protein
MGIVAFQSRHGTPYLSHSGFEIAGGLFEAGDQPGLPGLPSQAFPR